MKQIKNQTKLKVDLDILWKSLTKELHVVVPKIVPDKVKDVQILHGDGGLGTILLFNFTHVSFQKEEIVELDEIRHRVGVQVVEGGYLEHGFSFYKTTTQLGSGVEKGETVVDVEVTYEHEREIDETTAVAFTLQFLKLLEAYLLSDSSSVAA
ncbi:Phytohormone-binding protein CSBP [Linum grandiflorum]